MDDTLNGSGGLSVLMVLYFKGFDILRVLDSGYFDGEGGRWGRSGIPVPNKAEIKESAGNIIPLYEMVPNNYRATYGARPTVEHYIKDFFYQGVDTEMAPLCAELYGGIWRWRGFR